MEKSIDEIKEIEQLTEAFFVFVEEATDKVERFMGSDNVQDVVVMTEELGEKLSDAVKGLKIIKSVASIPTQLFIRKYEKFCRGLIQIPLEKRQRYIRILGAEMRKREGNFILNIINRLEEEEKIPFVLALLEAGMAEMISLDEYRRLAIMVDRTLYSDLLYLKNHITADPVMLQTESDYGLASSGLLVTAGNEWSEELEDDPDDTGIRFNYTPSAKKLAKILFDVECNDVPTNKGIVKLISSSDDEIDQMLKGIGFEQADNPPGV